MNQIEQIMKRLLFIAAEFNSNGVIEGTAKAIFYSSMGELMQLTGMNYQQAEDMLICWIENPSKAMVLKDVV